MVLYQLSTGTYEYLSFLQNKSQIFLLLFIQQFRNEKGHIIGIKNIKIYHKFRNIEASWIQHVDRIKTTLTEIRFMMKLKTE
jgi:hypothetical protein